MRSLFTLVLPVVFANIMTGFTVGDQAYEKNWPQWRGPEATGVAPHATPPVEWNEDKNIRWKIEISGEGNSSPVIWNDRIFVTTAVETDEAASKQGPEEKLPEWRRGSGKKATHVQEFKLLAVSRSDGEILWQRTAVKEMPHEGTHNDGTWAANSPVTDGEHVFAYFGSRGLYCYDMQGALLWETDLGDMQTRHAFGEGSSPVIYGDKIVVNWDHEGDSFIVALDKNSGKQLWKRSRNERTSWSTPIVVEANGKPQVIVNATNRTRAYDLESGDVIWEAGGMTVNTIPSPVSTNGTVFVMSGFRGSALQAIQFKNASGDITDSDAILWSYDQDTPYVPSPLLYGNALYFLKVNSAILSCFNTETGEPYYTRQRLEGIENIYASPVAADGKVYFVGRNGTTVVLAAGPEYKVLATNQLDDRFDASPAIVGDELILRGHRYLYSIAEE